MIDLVEDLDLVVDGDSEAPPQPLNSVCHLTGVAHSDQGLIHGGLKEHAREVAACYCVPVALLVLILEDLLYFEPAFFDRDLS